MARKKNDDALLKEFRAHLEALNRSANTIDKYILNVGRFLGFIHSREIESCVEVSFRDIERYQAWLLKQAQYCPSSVDTYMRTVRAFYKYLQRQNIIISNPADLVALPKQSVTLPRNTLTETEINDLLNMPDTKTDKGILYRAILETFYSTGVRISELCNLSLFDADTAGGALRVNEGKGGKDRIAPLGNSACLWIRVYRETVRPNLLSDSSKQKLFLGWQRGRAINPRVVQRTITDYAKKAGITKQVTPHVIRATTATHLLKRGASLLEVRDILGHELVTTTQRYTKVVPTDLIEAHTKFHPREK